VKPKRSEYEGHLALTLHLVRQRYLEAVRGSEPKVLEELAVEPLSAARACADEDLWEDISVRDALLVWALRWHLEDPWCMEAAFSTLFAWLRNAKLFKDRHWFSGGTEGEPDDAFIAERYHLSSFFDFDPRLETREHFLERATAEARAKLASYADAMLTRAKEAGLTEARAFFRDEHFQWLVSYQVLGRTWTEIARENHGISADTIRHAAKRLAEYIGLTRRPSSRSRH